MTKIKEVILQKGQQPGRTLNYCLAFNYYIEVGKDDNSEKFINDYAKFVIKYDRRLKRKLRQSSFYFKLKLLRRMFLNLIYSIMN